MENDFFPVKDAITSFICLKRWKIFVVVDVRVGERWQNYFYFYIMLKTPLFYIWNVLTSDSAYEQDKIVIRLVF